MKLPKAFYAGRVTETIDSIVKYVDQARDLAEDIKPARTVGPKWKKSPIPPRPKLSSIEPPFVESDPAGDPLGGEPLEINGEALKKVKRFALIPRDDLSEDSFVTENIDVIDKTKFKAVLDLTDADVGVYHAWFRDKYGQEDLLLNAFRITAQKPPEITKQPEDVTVALGDRATFEAEAKGTGTLTYQWKRKGADIPGETTPSLDIWRVDRSAEGSYSLVVANEAGSVTSRAARLRITGTETRSEGTKEPHGTPA